MPHDGTHIGLLIAGFVMVTASLLWSCTSAPQRVVETPIAVEIPGPVKWREIPEDLLTCVGRPRRLWDGMTGGELRSAALSWQAYAECLDQHLQAIGDLTKPAPH